MFGARARRLAGVASLGMLLVAPALPGATGGQVAAHAQLVASSPGSGEVLSDSPDQIRLVFSERLEPAFTSVNVRDGGGTLVTEGGEVAADDPYVLLLDVHDLRDSVYTVTWRTLSADDGHVTEGFFTFAVGDAFETLPGGGHESMRHASTDPVAVVGRWLTNVGLMLALGMGVFHAAVLRSPMRSGMRRLVAAGLVVAAAGTIAIGVSGAASAGAGPAYFVETRTGQQLLARAVLAALGGAAILSVAARLGQALAIAVGVAGIGLVAAAGHAAAMPGPVPLLVQIAHIGAAAIWAAGVLAMFLLWVRPRLFADRAPSFRELVPRFSALALVAIGLVGMTGLHAAWTQTGSLLPQDTEYWRVLMIKTVMAAGALAIGGANFVDGGRMLAWLPALRARMGLETIVIGVVLLATSLLAVTPPQEDAVGAPIQPIPDAFGVVAPDMQLEIAPGRPGVNRVVVTTTDALAGAAQLELSLDRLDDGTTTRVPLVLAPMEGMTHGHGAPEETHTSPDGTVSWSADALLLPAGSRWDTSVRVLSSDGEREITRQRFAFSVGADGIAEGRIRPLVDPGSVIGMILLVGGALALGLGLGGQRLPRCERLASRIGLLGGGSVAVLLGMGIGVTRVLGG